MICARAEVAGPDDVLCVDVGVVVDEVVNVGRDQDEIPLAVGAERLLDAAALGLGRRIAANRPVPPHAACIHNERQPDQKRQHLAAVIRKHRGQRHYGRDEKDPRCRGGRGGVAQRDGPSTDE